MSLTREQIREAHQVRDAEAALCVWSKAVRVAVTDPAKFALPLQNLAAFDKTSERTRDGRIVLSRSFEAERIDDLARSRETMRSLIRARPRMAAKHFDDGDLLAG
ncbi:MAG: hypothetical protein B7Y80_19335 [Hyphomicrobium sp. 32-62-53]|nr:MAG: hypothetical protein B7Z29_17870 [Hyphomicrobium sp. 12-62-95]OYX97573.1 MAG: hypothetical protein B7Y80_19335 [Hyphomicrobium sp. 32-62-53]